MRINVSAFGGHASMGVVPKAGNGEEGREDAGKGKTVRSSEDKLGCTAAVPTSALALLLTKA